MEKSTLSQLIALLLGNIGNLSSGLGFGYMGPYGQLIREGVKINENLHSLMVGCVSIGGLMGCFVSGKLADFIGRKRAMSVSFCFTTIGWLMVACSLSSVILLSGRILHGVGEGMVVAVSIIYLGELIEEKYRGGAIASVTVSCIFGIALAYILGVFLTWRVSAGLIALLNFGSLLGSSVLQESPYWLSHHGKLSQASSTVHTTDENSRCHEVPSEAESSTTQTLFSMTTIISTFIPPILLFICPITGVYSISFYALSLMEKMAIGHPVAVAIAVGLVRTFGSACGMGFVQRFGRRKSLIFSASTASILLASVSLLLQIRGGLSEAIFNWCMISLLVCVMYSNSVGMTPVPWILCGEWPDFQHKATVSAVGTFLYYVSVFLAAQLPGVLEPSLGLSGMFLVFAALSTVFLGVVLVFVPETDGKSYIQHIETNALNMKRFVCGCWDPNTSDTLQV